jgi:type I restriction enzyme S subunit
MTANEFLKKFQVFAAAPGAVDKIRELVLRMATSGRIAEQDPSDPPASELLEQIVRIRDKRIRAGTAKSRVQGRPIAVGDTGPIPESWVRRTIAQVCDLQTGATPSRDVHSYFGGDIPWLVSGDVNLGEIHGCRGRITDSGLCNSNCKIIPANSVLIALNGQGKTRGTVAITRIPAALNQSLVAMIPYAADLLLPEFIFWNLRSRYYAIRDITGQDQRRGLNMKLVGDMSLPIPPVREQKRIVAKVNELMALCDRLEAQQKERETRHNVLARASLSRFAVAPTPANLTFLFHESYTIPPGDLRKSILTLAVRGMLVPQGPKSDAATETVSEVTKTFRADDPHITPFDLPNGWYWLRVADAFEVAGGIQKTPERTPRQNAFPYVGVANVYRGRLELAVVKQFELAPGELEKKRLEQGDLLIIEGNGSFNEIGRCAKWNGEISDCVHQNHVIRCRPRDSRISDFVLLFLNSPDGTRIMQQLAITSSGLYSLSVGKIRQIGFPLPPLAEQRRIVAKVDQLMALVDDLETQLAASRATAAKLLDAIVGELTA